MGLEAASFLNDFVVTNPVAGDNVSQGDDHLRLIKATLKASFPNITRAIYHEQARVDLASASAPDLSVPASNYINITGTTQINGFALEPSGFTRLVRFAGTLTLNVGANFTLPTSDDIITAAGDHALVHSMDSGVATWRVLAYFKNDGRSLIPWITNAVTGEIGKFLRASGTGPGQYIWDIPVPIGAIVLFPGGSDINSTWLECSGGPVSRTTYAELFALLGTSYGVGNGSTTFGIPDYRGCFPRGWAHGSGNDPDRASRTDRGDGTTGDNVGTRQSHQFLLHGHPWRDSATSSGVSGSGGFTKNTISTADRAAFTGTLHDGVGGQIGGSGGSETRPINVNVNFQIKAKSV